METNPMKILYKHFGEEKEKGKEMYSIANVFYEMGSKENSNQIKKDKFIKELIGGVNYD